MATHSSILAWRIPWTEGLVRCSLWGGKELKTTEVTEHAHIGTMIHTLLPTGIFSKEKQLMIMKKWQ